MMNKETLTALAEKRLDTSDTFLGSFRKKHMLLFRENGMKEVTPDSYKFTNLESFFSPLEIDSKEFGGKIPSFKTKIPTITILDGEIQSSECLPEGVLIRKSNAHMEEVIHFMSDGTALSHLHHSMTNDGIIIEVPKNLSLSTPIRILTIITKSSVSAPTHLIVAHPFSKLTIIEETRVISSSSHALIPETYIVAHPSSQVEHIALDQDNEEGLHHGSVFIDVSADATVRTFFFTTAGRMVRKNLNLNLNAPGARGETYSLFLTTKIEHSDIYTVINHKSPDTTSDQMVKGIVGGDSRGIFTGKIHIHPKAQRVVSGQLNKNLLLSKKAQVHSQPQLEIFADDVKCSHGSTTGQLSEDEVFYFQARGIPAEAARNLLALGFGLEIVQKVQNKEAREHVMKIIRDMLLEKFSLGESV